MWVRIMHWPSTATSDTPLPEEPLVLDAQDGDVATYQACADPDCRSIRPGIEHAHLVKVDRATTTMP